jgi:hypothetical protein
MAKNEPFLNLRGHSEQAANIRRINARISPVILRLTVTAFLQVMTLPLPRSQAPDEFFQFHSMEYNEG